MDSSNKSTRARGVFPALAAAFLWGTAAVAVKQLYGVAQIDGVTIGFLRLAIAFPALALFCLKTVDRTELWPGWPRFGLMTLAGIFLAVSHVTFYWAIARVGVGVSALIVSATVPLATAFLGRIFLKEALSAGLILSLVLAVGGAVLLLGGQGPSGFGASQLVGVALAAGASSLLALVTLISRVLSRHSRPLLSATVACGVASISLAPLYAFGPATEIGLQGWLLLIYMGLASTALAYGLYFSALRHLASAKAGVLTLGEPLTAVLLATLLLGESLGLFGWLGAALVVASFINLYRLQTPGRP